MKVSQLRELQVNNTLVFETLGKPEKEREFNFASLKRWGFDLVFGKKDGKQTFFMTPLSKDKGDGFHVEMGGTFEIEELFDSMPKNKKVFARIEMNQGIAYLVVDLREGKENIEILRVPAGSILLAFLKKHKCWNVIEALRSVGSAAELRKQRGQEGKPVPYDKLPAFCKKFLKDAKKIEKETGFGRISLAFFGKNKDGDPRFLLTWFLPTISLFEIDLVDKIDKELEMFD